jgi:hypothetical protein
MSFRRTSLTAATVVTVLAGGFASATHAEPAPAWKRLYAERATASSYLKSNWNKYDENYHPAYLLDGNPKTAWVEGVDGNGEGQTVTIPLSDIKSARAVKLVVMNGYQKNKNLFEANAAPKEVAIEVKSATGDVVGVVKTELKKVMGPQTVVVPVERGGRVGSVTLTVVSTHAGKVYKDTCISDVEVYVDSDVVYSEKAEKAKLAALKTWVNERKATAAAFAAIKPDYPFAATHFKVVGEHTWDNEDNVVFDEKTERYVPVPGKKRFDQQFAEGKPSGIAKATFSDADWAALIEVRDLGKRKGSAVSPLWRRVDVARTAPLPDGFGELEDSIPTLPAIAAYMQPGNVTFFEAQGEAGGNSRSRAKGDADWVRTWTTTNARVATHDDGTTLKRVYFSERRVIEERETVDETHHYVLDFNGGGALVRVRRFATGDAFGSAAILDIERDGAGKVNTLFLRSVSGGIGEGSEWNSNLSVNTVKLSADGNS